MATADQPVDALPAPSKKQLADLDGLRHVLLRLAEAGVDRQYQVFVVLPAGSWGQTKKLQNWHGLPVRYGDVPYPLLGVGGGSW